MVLLLYEYVEDSWTEFKRFGIYGAWSSDGLHWDVVDRPIIDGADCGDAFVCSPFLVNLGDRVVMLYHADRDGPNGPLGDVYAVEIDEHLQCASAPLVACRREVFGSSNERVSDPYLFVEGSRSWLFAAIGPRLHQRLGLVEGRARLLPTARSP
jgi:hypothetical protein